MFKYAVRGLARCVIGAPAPRADPGTLFARYSYSLWLRHLVMAATYGQSTNPHVLCELGPGSSQGVGLAAILSGVSSYTSVDVVDYDVNRNNEALLDELVALFQRRADIPGSEEFSKLQPHLPDYSFPAGLLDERLGECLAPRRVDAVRRAVREPGVECEGISIRHQTVRAGGAVLDDGVVDMILSQAVLVYSPDPECEYRSMSRWLKPGGIMSHQLDYGVELSFPDAEHWNSHWGCSDWIWNLMRRNRTVIINRAPHSVHLDLMRKYGCEIICNQVVRDDSGLPAEELAKSYQGNRDDDLTTRSAFVIARKEA